MKRRLFKYHFKFNKMHDILIKSMNEITTSMKPIMNKVKDKKKRHYVRFGFYQHINHNY